MKFMILAHSITALGTIISPLIATEFILPLVFHPYNFGGIPFVPPNIFKYTFVYLATIILIIHSCATLSGMMYTVRECRKIEFLTAFLNAKWASIFALIGSAMLFFIPFIKAPLLVLMAFVPFSNLIVTGIILSFFTLFGNYIGTNYNLRKTCNE
jgi:hypothetical protein